MHGPGNVFGVQKTPFQNILNATTGPLSTTYAIKAATTAPKTPTTPSSAKRAVGRAPLLEDELEPELLLLLRREQISREKMIRGTGRLTQTRARSMFRRREMLWLFQWLFLKSQQMSRSQCHSSKYCLSQRWWNQWNLRPRSKRRFVQRKKCLLEECSIKYLNDIEIQKLTSGLNGECTRLRSRTSRILQVKSE